MHKTSFRAALAATVLALALVPGARADEGMWTFNHFPFERFEKTYGFRPSQAWLDHVRLASVRFDNGGSGSFVSADGLVITNHHVGADCIHKLSSAEHDYIRDGFVAATPADEKRCPDLELNVLESVETVTDRVRGAAAGKPAAAAAAARRAEEAAIEKECSEATGLRCDVVELYQGREYDLYRYGRYTDVRLAYAPEVQLAFFGGDPDNFEYPRFVVDAALFRVYRDGQPLHVKDYLAWSKEGPREGEVTFVSGNPGSTARLDTMAQLAALRDTTYPLYMSFLAHARDLLVAFSGRGSEQARVAQDDVVGVENSIKAISGYLSGLLDDQLMARKAAEEAELRARVEDDPALRQRVGDPWASIASAMDTYRSLYPRYTTLERGLGRAGRLAATARRIVRLTAEKAKPNGERLPEYRETSLPSLLQQLYSEAPIYPEFEEFQLAAALRRLEDQFGPVHPLVVEVLGDRSPEEVAHAAIAGTRLGEVAFRKSLVEGGAAAVAASDDPMIRLFRTVDPSARELRKRYEQEVDAVETQAGAKIAEVYFGLHDAADTYPDATFTLRLSYGTAKGYEEGGRHVPWHTTFRGLFERSQKFGARPPYDLPRALAAARGKLDLDTPLDFVTTNDIIGGNSGSPVVDRKGEFVGIIFDGNLYMLPNRFVYSDRQARAIAVDARAILETLRKVYPAGHLADELVSGHLRGR